jgi:hypothetical protein
MQRASFFGHHQVVVVKFSPCVGVVVDPSGWTVGCIEIQCQKHNAYWKRHSAILSKTVNL